MTEQPNTSTVAVIGGGLMGCGIAFVFAAASRPVIVVEPSQDQRNALNDRIASICGLLKVDQNKLAAINTINVIDETLSKSTLVIEAGPENLEIKREIFAQLDQFCDAEAILATNTSAIPISKIAEAAKNRKRIIGAHFWNPPHLVPLVEVVLGKETDSAIADEAVTQLASAGMSPVLVKKDIPGFIGNRLQHALKREAIALVANGVCDAQTVDTVVKMGFGARLPVMGPLEQSDLLGLELTLAIHETLIEDLDVMDGPHPFLRDLIAAGKSGAKVGEGFRKWTATEADAARQQLNEYLVSNALKRYADTDR